MSDILDLAEIAVGERDRVDHGDIEALAESIATVGLLHPIVVTDAAVLVAGGRRLDAVKRLGWTEVPVTVITLDTAEAVLRAEADENTQRKPLSPVEAERARTRRAKVLAPLAEKREKAGKPSPKLGEGRHDRETARIAAAGTGYSASTLDKVTEVRETAENEATPEPVREVAREQLDALDRGETNPTQAQREVRDQMQKLVDGDAEYQRASLLHAYSRAISQVRNGLLKLDPPALADALEEADWDALPWLRRDFDSFLDQIETARPRGLRVVGGS